MKKKHEEAAGIMRKGRMNKCSAAGIMGKGKMKKCSAAGIIMGKRKLKKCSVGTMGTKVVKRHDPELPIDVQLRILACLQIEDLFGSCLLVCKQWKDAILSSDATLLQQHKKSFWLYVRRQFLEYSSKSLVFQDGPYKVLNLTLSYSESVVCSDKGIVCIWDKQWGVRDSQLKVGNPIIKDKWKVIPIPLHFDRFVPAGMSVDTSTSPAPFKIVGFHFETTVPTILRTRVFDSKMNTWSKEKIISLRASSQDKLGGTLVHLPSDHKIVTCDVEQERWTVRGYLPPENRELHLEEEIVLCKEEPILVFCEWPWVMLWKENSWMTKLNIKAFLAQPELEPRWETTILFPRCLGDVITVMALLSSNKTALLNYDTRQGCWKFGGLMEGGYAGEIDMHFTPSLVRV